MRGELNCNEEAELLKVLKAIEPPLPEELLTNIMDRERRTSLGPDLDWLDYYEIWSLAGERAWFKFDLNLREDLEASCEGAINQMRTQGVDLSKAAGVILSVLLPSGQYSKLSGVHRFFKRHLHRASMLGLGSCEEKISKEQFSVLIIVSGIDMLEPFEFVGPEEDSARKLERIVGFNPIGEIPVFLLPKKHEC